MNNLDLEIEAINYYNLLSHCYFIVWAFIIFCVFLSICFLTTLVTNIEFEPKDIKKHIWIFQKRMTLNFIVFLFLTYLLVIIPSNYLKLKKYNFIACNDIEINEDNSYCNHNIFNKEY